MNTGLPSGKGAGNLAELIKGFAFFMWRQASKGLMKKPVGTTVQMGCKTKLSAEVKNAYSAPFPDNTYKAAARKFPYLVPTNPAAEATPFMQLARKELANWNKPALIMFSDGDPITGHLDKFFYKLIPTARQNPSIKITGAGHFLQEDKGEEIAANIQDFMKSTQ